MFIQIIYMKEIRVDNTYNYLTFFKFPDIQLESAVLQNRYERRRNDARTAGIQNFVAMLYLNNNAFSPYQRDMPKNIFIIYDNVQSMFGTLFHNKRNLKF